jgi:hypothetical protein
MTMSIFLVGATALSLGLRHGIDIDHIAAILDMTGTTAAERHSGDKRLFGVSLKSIKLPALYIFGHAVMVLLLGCGALYFGAVIPDWIDKIMERTVGVTLLLLSTYLMYSLYMFSFKSKPIVLRSRWMLVFDGFKRAWFWCAGKISKHPLHHPVAANWDNKGAFSIGLIHGFGAETGTQVLLFAAVAGSGSLSSGLYMLCAFTIGMIVSTLSVGICLAAGLATSRYLKWALLILGIFAAMFSLIVGVYFTLGEGDLLPSLT